ncbi:MAG TPA: class II histone deacetylase [Solirubrobacterales bacterium]|jgi:acetoin utilization deacetylase AcuC-like enzyme|nr:class II histone deacetylase [Solirubrobacterales bacterium]
MVDTGWIWDDRYLLHDGGPSASYLPAEGPVEADRHVENPEIKRRTVTLLEYAGLLQRLIPIAPRLAEEEEILRFHDPAYLRRVVELSEGEGGETGEGARMEAGGYELARLAVGGGIVGVDAIVDGEVDNAYAILRPGGHHAERHQGRGFCIFANSALAALHAVQVRGLERVAILDWDVHHGNGTQQAFYSDPSVLTISVHEEGNFPSDQGFAEETGEDAGEGLNVNVPIPPGSGSGAYELAFESIVLPALRAYRPQLLILAAGYDASGIDPLGHMLLTSETFRWMTERVMEVADECCDGKLLTIHEGGYSEAYVPFCALAVVEALTGIRTGVDDPFLDYLGAFPTDALAAHQAAALERVRDFVDFDRLSAA